MQIIGLFNTYPNNVLTACPPNGESVHTYCESVHIECLGVPFGPVCGTPAPCLSKAALVSKGFRR